MDETRHAAFVEEVLRHVDRLYWFALMLTRDPVRAEDLVQQTVLRALEKAEQCREPGGARPWLFAILRNLHRMTLRERAGPADGAAPDPALAALETELYPPPLTPDVLVERELAVKALERAIEDLPPAYREVLVLADLEGLTYEEVAAVVACSLGTVKSRLYRARNRLRLRLAADHGQDVLARRATR